MLGHPRIRSLDPGSTLEVDYTVSCDELLIIALSWLDQLCGHIRDESLGYHAITFAGDYLTYLSSSMELSFGSLNNFISAHDEWAWSVPAGFLALRQDKIIDCTKPMMQYLLTGAEDWGVE